MSKKSDTQLNRALLAHDRKKIDGSLRRLAKMGVTPKKMATVGVLGAGVVILYKAFTGNR